MAYVLNDEDDVMEDSGDADGELLCRDNERSSEEFSVDVGDVFGSSPPSDPSFGTDDAESVLLSHWTVPGSSIPSSSSSSQFILSCLWPSLWMMVRVISS